MSIEERLNKLESDLRLQQFRINKLKDFNNSHKNSLNRLVNQIQRKDKHFYKKLDEIKIELSNIINIITTSPSKDRIKK